MKKKQGFLLFILSTLVACSGLEQSEEKKIREHNLTIAPIQRQSNETLFNFPAPTLKAREPYPWESRHIGSHLRITKEFFRCHGKPLNTPIQIQRQSDFIYHLDCAGIETHSLPLKEGKEFIYPILIDLLNHLQSVLNKKVIVTCGHRCPSHNLYADPSPKSQSSKHLIGAEVDFYVEGLEYNPQVVIAALQQYYSEPMHTQGSTWRNKEVAITLYQANEGRDLDNNHPYPYISIQVLYDRETGTPVQYNWHKAHNGYIKYQ